MGGGGENDVPSFLAHFILGRVDLSSRLRQSRQLYKVGERETELLVFYGHYQDPTDSNSLSLSAITWGMMMMMMMPGLVDLGEDPPPEGCRG